MEIVIMRFLPKPASVQGEGGEVPPGVGHDDDALTR